MSADKSFDSTDVPDERAAGGTQDGTVTLQAGVKSVQVAVSVNVTATGRPEDAERLAKAVIEGLRALQPILPPGAVPGL